MEEYIYTDLKQKYNEDSEYWEFEAQLKTSKEDEPSENDFVIGYCKGVVINKLHHRECSLEDVLDEESQDGYDLAFEITCNEDNYFIEDLVLIKFLEIQDEFKKQGYGTQLLKLVLKAFNGYKVFLSPVDFTNEFKNIDYLKKFYSKFGFEKYGQRYLLKKGD